MSQKYLVHTGHIPNLKQEPAKFILYLLEEEKDSFEIQQILVVSLIGIVRQGVSEVAKQDRISERVIDVELKVLFD